MAAILNLTTGVVYLRSWSGTVSGSSLSLTGTLSLADGTVNAPSATFTSGTGLGLYVVTPGTQLGIAAAGHTLVNFVDSTGVGLAADLYLGWTPNNGNATTAPDVKLFREAAAILQLSNGTTGQTFKVYGTTAPGTNTQWTEIGNDGNVAFIRANQSGSTITLPTQIGGNVHDTQPNLKLRSSEIVEINTSGGTSVWRTTAGKQTVYNNVTTAGWGMPAVYAAGAPGSTVNVGVASIATYTVGAADGDFEVSASCLVTVSTTHSFSLDVVYTDTSNAPRTMTLPVNQLAGTFVTTGLITNVTGAGPYESAVMHISAKASTSITIRTSAGGTFTTVTYFPRAIIKQMA